MRLRRRGASALFALSLARLNRRRPRQRCLPLDVRSAGEGGARLSRLEPFFLVAGCILAAVTFAAYYSARVITWAVMTDELQTTKLATSIAETGSLVPRIHGSYYGALSQLYPLLIAPFYGLMSSPAAATAAHALNPFLFASAAWPAYLLARSVTASRAAGYAAAVLTAWGSETLSVTADSVDQLDRPQTSVSARLRKVDLPRPLRGLAGESSAFDVDPADLVFARARQTPITRIFHSDVGGI